MNAATVAERKARILQVLRAGNFIGTAITVVGLTRPTFDAWRAEDPDFDAAVRRTQVPPPR